MKNIIFNCLYCKSDFSFEENGFECPGCGARSSMKQAKFGNYKDPYLAMTHQTGYSFSYPVGTMATYSCIPTYSALRQDYRDFE